MDEAILMMDLMEAMMAYNESFFYLAGSKL